MPRLTTAKAIALKAPAQGQAFLWCSEVRGLGVRVTAAGARSFVVQFRDAQGRTRRIALGSPHVLPLDGPKGARALAQAALNARRDGQDAVAVLRPAPTSPAPGLTLDGIWQAYQDAGCPLLHGTGRKRPSTIHADTLRYRKHISPALGSVSVTDLTTGRVQRHLDTIPARGQRDQVLLLVKSLLSFARSRDLAPIVPTIAIKANKSRERQTFYTIEELARLDRALIDLASEHQARRQGFDVLRLLLATGARFGEVASAEWHMVDLVAATLTLTRDKTSDTGRIIHLTPEAVALIASLPREIASSFLFPAPSRSGHITTVQRAFDAACTRAGVPRHRIHDLRHSFAARGVRAGVSIYVIGRLLGHRQATTSQRYAHLEHDAAQAAVAAIGKILDPQEGTVRSLTALRRAGSGDATRRSGRDGGR